MDIKKVNVSIHDNYLNNYSGVVHQMKQAGLNVEQELKTVGVVTGSIDSKNLPRLKQVPGVASVEPDQAYQIAPPDSDLQ